VGDVMCVHGHRKIVGKKMIMGHEHPFIHIRDQVGATLSLPCYLISEDLVVMPAFSPLASGTDVSSADRQDYLSSTLRAFNVRKFRVLAVSNIGLLDFSSIENLQKVNV
jgi:hypothetical protein